MKKQFLPALIGVALLSPALLCAQVTTPASLRLLPPDKETYHELEVNINAKDLKAFRTSRGLKLGTIPKKMSFDKQPLTAETMKLRGKTSLKFRRKSYRVELDDDFNFATNYGNKPLNDFHLLSLTMDRGYYGNRLAFDCLEEAGVFKLYRAYTELKINGQSEGLYGLIQRPEDYAIKDLGAPYVLRRSAVDFVIADYKSAKDQTPGKKIRYDKVYEELIAASKNLEGQAQFDFFRTHLDLDAYCTWLALNHWFQNGDYTDELLFYVMPDVEPTRFGIIPWDFDDVFATAPHEDWPRRNAALGDKLLFSSEVSLDRSIANNPLLYTFYLQKMKALLLLFPEEKLRSMFGEIYQDLYPYFKRPAVLEMSQYDRQKKTDLVRLEQQMNESFQFLLKRRGDLLKVVE
ncbi:CotH kinase family protein [Haliscomenobacter hydrossis]|uniref:Spore coat protein CotH n=1 Tax=Haliscomenobacter hydrossis (strain ATCC 27775 / DSM 1100 / LMG 10767 / O) TaxID=760192 RepID=F4L5H2_HALH1|nr:CotH kinase family protein [Haliscomenobacter hydrossis]AEE50836.1 Spore coat protein CotH [Haliscomenobacter hydrossis DSM 1100]